MKQVQAPPSPIRLTIPIEGMRCAGCAGRIEKSLQGLAGMNEASVNFASEQASVDFDPDKLKAEAIARSIVQSGYRIPVSETKLRISGMTCASCAGRVEKALRAVSGVESVQVNVATEIAHVATRFGTNEQRLIAAVRGAGYDAERAATEIELRAEEDRKQSQAARRELVSLLIAAALTLPLVAPMALSPLAVSWMLPGWAQLCLAGVVQFYFGARFYRGAWSALRSKTANMDTLVALGTSAAFGLSVWHMTTGGHLYFESAAAIITLIRLGKWMEARAKRSTTGAIRALLDLRPARARVRREGEEIEVPSETVGRGEVVVVLPGERIPVDGTVVDGESEVDESLLTGESLPVPKKPGDQTTGGGINGSGRLTIEATRVGSESALARVVELVQRAQGGKAKVQTQVDKVAAVFVPVVLLLAVSTFVVWWAFLGNTEQAFVASVSVLVIACPCALGLATPAALTVGTGKAAGVGILFSSVTALERAKALDTIVFDKTGTLTEGRPEVVDLLAEDQEGTLALAAAVQKGSEHPLARAIREEAQRKGLVVPQASQFRALPGRGIQATVNGKNLLVGSPRLRGESTGMTSPFDEAARELESKGRTVVWVFDEEKILGAIALGDRPRAGANAALASLRARGLELVLLSGDNENAARAVADELGIGRVFSEVLPDEKAATISALESEGRTVAMVGDGVNDAPALATAHVGIAMGTGADVALHAADITLMRPDLTLVGAAISISEATTRKVHQNLFWAFLYNILGIPLAAFGLLSPMIAGGAMALSSVSVLLNALSLRRWRSV